MFVYLPYKTKYDYNESFLSILTLIILVTLFACKDKTPQSDENLAKLHHYPEKYTAVPEAPEISWEGKNPQELTERH